MTINRFCSSGLQAVAMAADRIRLGEADLMIAGGTESMSMVPMMGHKIALNPRCSSDENIGIAYGMGITAEKVAERSGRSRARSRMRSPSPCDARPARTRPGLRARPSTLRRRSRR